MAPSSAIKVQIRERCHMKIVNFFLLMYKTKTLNVAVDLFRNRSQKTSKCGKNISGTLAYSYYLPHFDVICDLQMNRHMAT